MSAPWLVIACPGARADELHRATQSLAHDPDRTVIVTSRHHDRLLPDQLPSIRNWYVIDHRPRFSLPALWNEGLRRAYDEGATEVAVFASDVTGNPDSIDLLASLMRTTGCVMAGPAFDGHTRILDGPRTTHDRVPGGCFMLAAEHRLLCDEAYRWWYGDDSLEMAARQRGPVGVFAGTGLSLPPDAGLDTPEKQAWADEDRARFVAQWGCEPW